ncbi:hypothetical protein [Sphingomonas sp.]|uniref:hypothetical protein n=1 Tax=Sphingomonas sp. TaxID=28214 RepID=UPI002FDAF926
MSTQDPVLAALVPATELERLGKTFTRFCPVDEAPTFDDLLRKIDEADQPRLDDARRL